MMRHWPAGLTAAGSLLVLACATYHAAPLDPAAQPALYNGRSVVDSGLVRFRIAAGEPATSPAWRPADLALAALYFLPTLDEARAHYGAAEAAEITAGARPRPGVNGSLERNLSSSTEDSPWGAQLVGTFTIELGGKRGARLAIARAGTLAAEGALRELAWTTAVEARAAGLRAASAFGEFQDTEHEQEALDSLVPMLESRYREGAASQTDLAQLLAEVQAARLATRQAELVWRQAEAAAAAAAGLSVDQLRVVSLTGESATACGELDAPPTDSLQLLALGSRWSVAEALAAYQVAEGQLRLEIARQRPDLELGPGLFFDHGITRFLVNFGLPFLPGGNTGPIAEAEARRTAAAAHVAATQEAVMVETDQALDECSGLVREFEAADSVIASAERRAEVARAAYRRGEVTRLEVAFAELQAIRASRAHQAVVRRGWQVRARLEAAVGVWATDGPARWPDVVAQPRRSDSKEDQ